MVFDKVRQHIFNCEKMLEHFYLQSQHVKTLSALEKNERNSIIASLSDRTLALISDVNKADPKNFQLAPEAPFTKQKVLKILAEYQKRLDELKPNLFAKPRP